MSACVGETDVIDFFVVHKVRYVKKTFPFLDFGREWMLTNSTNKSLSVFCLVIMFLKWVFYPDVSAMRLFVFNFN